MTFTLHPQLANDCHYLGDFPLCALLLSKDANYPWFIMVPRRVDIREAFELTADEQLQLQRESLNLSQLLNNAFKADKMNIAALGNMVPQLHLHHIVRYTTDAAWPKPIWEVAKTQAYNDVSLNERIDKTLNALADTDFIANQQLKARSLS